MIGAMEPFWSGFSGIVIGIGLSAACGFRIILPFLGLSIAAIIIAIWVMWRLRHRPAGFPCFVVAGMGVSKVPQYIVVDNPMVIVYKPTVTLSVFSKY